MKYKLLTAIAALILISCGESTNQLTEPTTPILLKTTASSSAATIIRIPDKQVYDKGENVKLIVVANTGYSFAGWTGDTTDKSDTLSLMMNTSKAIFANLKNLSGKTVFPIITKATNGTIELSPAGDICDSGAVISVKAVPVYGFKFTGWSGGLSGSDTNATIKITKGIELTANFDIDPNAQFATLNISPTSSNGEITLKPQGAKVGDTYKYKPGTSVTISVESKTGYVFSGWTGDSACTDTGKKSFTIILDKNFTAGALFTKLPSGTRWELISSGTTQTLHAATWTGSKIIAVGDSGTVVYSNDGTNWTEGNVGKKSTSLIDITWTGNQLVAIGTPNLILTSPNGITWTIRDSTKASRLSVVAWTGKKIVAAGPNGIILTSTDGVSWASRSFIDMYGMEPTAMIWTGQKLFCVGYSTITALYSSARTFISTDGNSWESTSPSFLTNPMYSVTWNGTDFIGAGGNGSVFYAAEGKDWTSKRWSPQDDHINTSDLRSVTWTGNEAIAVGESGLIVRSEDGKYGWTQMESVTGNILNSVIWTGKMLIAVGQKGTIITSL